MIIPLLFALVAGTTSEARPARCSPPLVLLSETDKSFTVRFWAGTPRRRATEDSVRAAFRSACSQHLLVGSTIPQLKGVSSRRLFLENQPNANTAVIEADQRPDHSWRLVLGYPFVDADKSMKVPTAAEIEEAIYCAVRGASAKEQKEVGRCLPD